MHVPVKSAPILTPNVHFEGSFRTFSVIYRTVCQTAEEEVIHNGGRIYYRPHVNICRKCDLAEKTVEHSLFDREALGRTSLYLWCTWPGDRR